MGEVTFAITEGQPPFPLHLRTNRRARRYILRVSKDGAVTLTIPAFGSQKEAMAFLGRNRRWLDEQMQKITAAGAEDRSWRLGTVLLLNGSPVPISIDMDQKTPCICLGDFSVCQWPGENRDLRPWVEAGLWRLAWNLLPARVAELNAADPLPVRRVVVRNQRSRWGSCSRRGTISLNWRLVQAPANVRDYIIMHELTHLRFMNHSSEFWKEVERVCPDWKTAEAWLRENSRLIR